MDYALAPQDIALRCAVALLCGLLIGIDREIKHKSVGVRTYLLVCLGSAGFGIAVIEITHFYMTNYSNVSPDPTRVLQGIVTGIGFLGGGAIIQNKGSVFGIATGASIWVCGAVGVSCGFGFYWHALILSGFAFGILAIIGLLRVKYREDIDSDKGHTSNNAEMEK